MASPRKKLINISQMLPIYKCNTRKAKYLPPRPPLASTQPLISVSRQSVFRSRDTTLLLFFTANVAVYDN